MYNTYYPQFSQPNYSQQYSQPVTQDERIWVNNEVAADAYLVAPNGFVRLWDSNANRFYEKRADASGRPYPMRRFEYKEVLQDSAPIDTNYEELSKRISRLEEMIDNVPKSDADDTAV